MFRKRESRKPGEDFYLDFKKSYTHIGLSAADAPATPAQSSNTLNNSIGMSLPTSMFDGQDEGKDHTLDSMGDWKLDHASYLDQDAFTSYTGYWPPTPDVNSGSIYHGRDDAYNHNMTNGLPVITGLETPLSRPVTHTAFEGAPCGSLTMNDFLPSQYHPPNLFTNYNGYQVDHSGFTQSRNPNDLHKQHAGLYNDVPPLEHSVSTQSNDTPQKFRFRVNLLTATAMIKSADEIPLTYLNKCQAYKLSIKDSLPEPATGSLTRYRTCIRISFDDEQQRERPGHCWQLWKEGRGMNEAHQRGGKLQAVEFVPHGQGQSGDRSSSVELLSEAFDGFCIAWTPTYQGQPECEIQLRFNFLSTDFSHSKGVKGIPVRLCAKTEVLSSSSSMAPPTREVSYCKVKLFRDHGAERKIANDEAHVKKNIEKLTQQIGQAQTLLNESGKRRRSDSMSGSSRPTKIGKHKRASSISSSSSNGVREGTDDDLHSKLASLNSLLRSRRPDSRLFLEGDEQDDPDLFPVTMPGSAQEPSIAVDSPENVRLERRSTQMTSTSAGSPTMSTASAGSPPQRTVTLLCPNPFAPLSREPSNESRRNTAGSSPSQVEPTKTHIESASPAGGSTKVEKIQKGDERESRQWLDAIGVDQKYQAPPVNTSKPVACFYIQQKSSSGKVIDDSHYRAIYLRQRTLQDFVQAIARKCNVVPTSIVDTVKINSKGLRIKVDDELLAELPEGQDMQIEFESVVVKKEEDLAECSQADYILILRF